MNAKITVEEAADRLEAIARASRVQVAIGEMVSSFEKGEFAADEVSDDPQEAVSGAAVLRTLAEMCKDRK